MTQYFIDVVKKQYLDYMGRATRKQYWMYVLWYFILMVVLSIVAGIFGALNETLGKIASLLLFIVSIGLILPTLCIQIRRVRDLGISGWFTLVGIVPFIGGLALLIADLLPTDALAGKFNK